MMKKKNTKVTDRSSLPAAVAAAVKSGAVNSGTTDNSPVTPPLPPSVMSLLKRSQYSKASDLLRTLPQSPLVRETLGVCLLRCGLHEQAVVVFRSLALLAGTTIVRSEAPDSVRVNFATAMTLCGSPSGGLDLLEGLHEPAALAVTRLRTGINRWAASLSFWRRLDWKLSRIEPRNCRVMLDFEPGDFPFQIESTARELSTPNDTTPNPKQPKLAA